MFILSIGRERIMVTIARRAYPERKTRTDSGDTFNPKYIISLALIEKSMLLKTAPNIFTKLCGLHKARFRVTEPLSIEDVQPATRATSIVVVQPKLAERYALSVTNARRVAIAVSTDPTMKEAINAEGKYTKDSKFVE